VSHIALCPSRVTASIAQAMMPLLVHSTHGSTLFPEVPSARAPHAQARRRATVWRLRCSARLGVLAA
jgi:hypothetical protein